MSVSSIYIGHSGSENSALSEKRKASRKIQRIQSRFLHWTIFSFKLYRKSKGNKTTLPEVTFYEYSPIPLVHKQTIVFEARKYAALLSRFISRSWNCRVNFFDQCYLSFQVLLTDSKEIGLWRIPLRPHWTLSKSRSFYCILFNPLHTFQSRWQGWEAYKHNSFPIRRYSTI